MAEPATLPRLWVEPALGPSRRLDLPGPQAHHLRNVLRRGPGDAVRLFNGRDGEWLATIAAATKSAVALACDRKLRAQAAGPDVWLCFAPVKKEALEAIATQATELGAAVLQPVLTRRTVVGRVNLERLAAQARGAAEQSERLDLPEVRPARPLDALVRTWDPRRVLLLCAETGPAPPLAAVLPAVAGNPAAILTGPEGGFAQEELDALGDLPFVRAVGLGPRVLRAETAALAALACWQASNGDWRDRPPLRAGS